MRDVKHMRSCQKTVRGFAVALVIALLSGHAAVALGATGYSASSSGGASGGGSSGGDAGPATVPPEALTAMMENLLGTTTAEPIPEKVLETAAGQQRFLERRVFLGRAAAVDTVPHLGMGWKMPGSKLGQWVTELRAAAGVPPQRDLAQPQLLGSDARDGGGPHQHRDIRAEPEGGRRVGAPREAGPRHRFT